MPRSKTLEEFFGKQTKALKRLLRKQKTTKAREVLVKGVKPRKGTDFAAMNRKSLESGRKSRIH